MRKSLLCWIVVESGNESGWFMVENAGSFELPEEQATAREVTAKTTPSSRSAECTRV